MAACNPEGLHGLEASEWYEKAGRAQALQKRGPALLSSSVVLGESPDCSGGTSCHPLGVKWNNRGEALARRARSGPFPGT